MNDDRINLTDAQIIAQVINGECEMFECLIKRYKNYIFTVVSDHIPYSEVNEMAHVVFMEAYKALENCRNKASFKFWLKSIALRKCFDYWRFSYREKSRFVKELSEEQRKWMQEMADKDAFQQFRMNEQTEEARELLKWVLDQLSPRERMVIKLLYFDSLSVREAADLLGWSGINVKVQSFRIRRKLNVILSKVLDREVS